MSIADLRTVYRRATLDEADVDADPFVQFQRWLDEAIGADALEPTAMTLATVDADGRPSARVVLLKGLDRDGVAPGASGRGFVWFTNYDSAKGRALAAHPHAALCFFWSELERQVRVAGPVERAGADESDRYFASRPVASRIGAWASPQSEAIASRDVIEAREASFRRRFGVADAALDAADAAIDAAADAPVDAPVDAAIPRPPHWGGYRLVPTRIEFWQGRPSRLHDRIAYDGGDGRWHTVRLAP